MNHILNVSSAGPRGGWSGESFFCFLSACHAPRVFERDTSKTAGAHTRKKAEFHRVDRAGAHRTPEIFQNRPSSRSDLRVLSVKEDEISLPRYHISRLAFGGLEHIQNLRRPCRHQRRAPVVTRLVHISSTGKQDSNMRGSIAPARGEERSQPILVRGDDLE